MIRVKRSVPPIVSIIIPTFNRAALLRRALESLTLQTFIDFEVLVCDDGSSDNTSEVIPEFSRRLTINYNIGANSGGPARPRNRGIGLARGRYIAFLDSDDWWLPEKLMVSVRHLDAGSDIVFHDLWYVSPRGHRMFRKRIKSYQPNRARVCADLLIKGNALPTSSVVVRSEILRQIRGFSEDVELIATEDFDAWLRICDVTKEFTRIATVLGYYSTGVDNLSDRTKIAQLHRHAAIYDRHMGRLDAGQRREAMGTLSYIQGRTLQLSGDSAGAGHSLLSCIYSRAPLSFRVKAVVWLIRLWSQITWRRIWAAVQ